MMELRGENRFKTKAYLGAAKAVVALDTDDLGPLLRSGELQQVRGVGPATLGVLRDLIETGESAYYEQLKTETPVGLLELMNVPGLGPDKISQIHEGIGISSLDELEEAARDGRLAALKKFGPKTAEKILAGISFVRNMGTFELYPQGAAEADRMLTSVLAHPDVMRAEIAGEVRRRMEIVPATYVVAACRESPARVAGELAQLPGAREVTGSGRSLGIRFVDGSKLRVHCTLPDEFAVGLFRCSGSDEHVAEMTARLGNFGITVGDDRLLNEDGNPVPTPEELDVYAAAGLPWIPPELREGRGEIDAAARNALPVLVELQDLQGVLHCHSNYSDGTTSIADMALAARERGWSYIGITDHSQNAFYAGGLSKEKVLRQHEEIDALNALSPHFRILKGIEADILPDGRVDYHDDILDLFDFVVGSVHSRFSMDESEMTTRVLRAMDDPRLTILGHPTGRLLLNRKPYPIDINAVIEKAAERGVALELNADPHRLDLDWRYIIDAKRRGVTIEIGPDAHSPRGLDYVHVGIGIARKGWLERGDILNTRGVDDVLAFARRRLLSS